MPRDGSGIYTKPFPDVVTGTTIASTVHNGIVSDVETDLNAPRPIIAGGTGATNADGALVNLSGEKAAQIVTNYDSQLWMPGSFRSAIGATAAPNTTDAFAGIVYISEPLVTPPTNQNVVVEARSMVDGKLYVRRKNAGVWGVWGAQDADYVNVTGDTMTGNLTIETTQPQLSLNRTTPSVGAAIFGALSNLPRWGIVIGNSVTEAGGNTGSDFEIFRFNDAGGQIDGPLSINRASGLATFGRGLNITGALNATGVIATNTNLQCGAVGTTGTIYFGNTGTKYITYDPTNNFTCQGGSFNLGNLLNINHAGGQYHQKWQLQGVREWAMSIVSPGSLVFDDLTGGAIRTLTLMPFDGSKAGVQFNRIGSTVSPATAHISSALSNEIYLSTSSIRYKTDVKSLEKVDADKILELRPVTYRSKIPTDEPHRTHFGFIAEEVAEIEPRLVIWGYLPEDWIDEPAAEGKLASGRRLREGAKLVPDGMAYDRISALAVFKAREQEGRIKAQEDRIAELIRRIEALEVAQATP